MEKKRLIVALSGASGAPLGVELIRQLVRFPEIEVHLVLSRAGEATLTHETGLTAQELRPYVHEIHPNDSMGASLASGSFRTLGMVVVPCSMKTLAGIVSGYSDTLLLRSADVTMKERRPLILVPRECPFSTLHLRNLAAASELGCLILPPVPAYYNHPQTIEDVNRHIVGKILSTLDLEHGNPEWSGLSCSGA